MRTPCRFLSLVSGFWFLVSGALPAHAQQTIEGYDLAIGLPEVGGITPGASLSSLLTYFFNLSLILAGLAGFIALLVGGVMYMTSEVVDTKARAREIIQGAFIGLLLLVGTYVILLLINPQLLEVPVPTFPQPKPPGTIAGHPPGLRLAAEGCSPSNHTQCLSEVCVSSPEDLEGGTCAKSGLDDRCYSDRDCDKSADTPPVQLICDQNIKRCSKPDFATCTSRRECGVTTCCGYPIPFLPGTPNRCLNPQIFFRPFICVD